MHWIRFERAGTVGFGRLDGDRAVEFDGDLFGRPAPAAPLYFPKPRTNYATSRDAIRAPVGYDGKVVFEGELGIVIGRRGRGIAAEHAAGHIFGRTVVNDVIAIGASPGVAPMRPGMTVEIGIEGIGTLVKRYEGAAAPKEGP